MNDPNSASNFPTVKKSGGQNLLQNGLVVLGLTGFVGGMIGAILSEVIQSPESEQANFFPDSLYKSTGVWFALAMLGIGAAMSVSQGITERNPEKSTRAALLAVPAAVVGGFFAGVIAQWVYGKMVVESSFPNEVPRSIGWAIAGGLGGAAIGLGFRSAVRVRNCLLGGLAGGFVGGLAFNSIGEIVQSGTGSRFVGITLIGTLMGVAVGLIDMVTVSCFVEQTMREGAPVRFALFDQSTLLGCANNVGITVKGDPGVSEHHVRLTKQGNSASFQCVGSAAPITVNGQSQTSGTLSDGDIFVIGRTQFRFVSSKSRGGIGTVYSQGQPTQNQSANSTFSGSQQPPARQSVPMQPVTQRPVSPSNTSGPSSPQPTARPVIPIKKTD